jgi:hypothetical protein
MNRRVPTEMSLFCVEKLRNSGLLRALIALIQSISSRHALDPELIRDSLRPQYILGCRVDRIRILKKRAGFHRLCNRVNIRASLLQSAK